jgi:SNF2 family DNA or RNA helicase
MPAVLLADDMGLGKTVQAIAAISQLHAAGHLQDVLVVAPAGLLAHWRRSFAEFAPGLRVIRVSGPVGERAWQWRADHLVHIVGYETLRNDAGAARSRRWDLVVLDEAQRIKNRETAVSRACKVLPRLRSWALTGTPLENRVDDLASILEFVRANPDGARLSSLSAGISLMMRHQELQLRRRKQEVLTQLPPRTDVRLEVELSPAQRRSYRWVLDKGRLEIAELGDKATVLNVLEVLMRLKQVCNFDPTTGESAKLVDLTERLAELVGSGHRALVFSQFTSHRFGVEKIASDLGRFRPLTYTGGLGLREREEVIERFKSNDRHSALILSIRAGGQGLNLQTASYVFHFDRWWNPAVENQASDRVHRMGQTNAVTVYTYTTPDTIEQRIEQILDEKQALFARLVDRVTLDPTRLLSPAEIFGLIGLEAPRRLRDKLAPTPLDPIASLVRLLEGQGWLLDRIDPGIAEGLVVGGHRDDEIGLQETLLVHRMKAASQEAIERVRREVPSHIEVVVVVDEAVEPEQVSLAAESGVQLVDTKQLAESAMLVGQSARAGPSTLAGAD